MFHFNKSCLYFVLVGIIIIPLLFSACSNSRERNVDESVGAVVKGNIETLRSEGYSEEAINRLMDILKQLNQPVALGTEKITEAGTYIQQYNQIGTENYSEEYLWFLTDEGGKYYVYIQKKPLIIYFVCKGELDSGDYIYRAYQ